MRIARVLVGLTLGLGLLPLPASDFSRLRAPIVAAVSGEVQVIMPGGVLRPLHLQESLPLGAKLQTGDSGELLLALQPGIAVLLGNGSHAYISDWKRAPTAESILQRDPGLPIPASTVTVTLEQGALYGVVEPGAAFERILTVNTTIGQFICKGGSFGLDHLIKNIQAVVLHGGLEMDTRYYKIDPDPLYQGKLTAARSILIPQSGKLETTNPLTKSETPNSVYFSDDVYVAHLFSATATTLMEAISLKITGEQMLAAMSQDLSQVGAKDGTKEIQVPLITHIGQELAPKIVAGRIRPEIAQLFIDDIQSNGLTVSDDTATTIRQAIRTATTPAPPATPPAADSSPAISNHPKVDMEPEPGPPSGKSPIAPADKNP